MLKQLDKLSLTPEVSVYLGAYRPQKTVCVSDSVCVLIAHSGEQDECSSGHATGELHTMKND